MEKEKKKKLFLALGSLGILLVLLMMGIVGLFFLANYQPEFLTKDKTAPASEVAETVVEESEIEDGIHVETGLVAGEGLTAVINNCTNCHSAKLVTQNRATKEGWIQIIRWMQETQNLWDLGENEAVIVSYLSTHYAPEQKGRRKPLEVEWYKLE